MTENRTISVTLPQLRMLRRAIRGERLPIGRFRLEGPTVAALARKGMWHILDQGGGPGWYPTALGHRVGATRNGKLQLTADGQFVEIRPRPAPEHTERAPRRRR